MYMRYYDGYPSDGLSPSGGEAILPESAYNECEQQNAVCNNIESPEEPAPAEQDCPAEVSAASFLPHGIFSSMQSDDIILIALLLILLTESKDDFIMPIVIGYLLLSK